MSTRTILTYPAPCLREVAKPVAEVTRETGRLVTDLLETMYSTTGCGLAAPQIGVSLRVFVLHRIFSEELAGLVFINPEILEKHGEVFCTEGCLSFPGVYQQVARAERVKVKALNRRGKPFELEASGLFAVAIQHENDHLDGVLMIDRLGAEPPPHASQS